MVIFQITRCLLSADKKHKYCVSLRWLSRSESIFSVMIICFGGKNICCGAIEDVKW